MDEVATYDSGVTDGRREALEDVSKMLDLACRGEIDGDMNTLLRRVQSGDLGA
jgi:hypothetical protein